MTTILGYHVVLSAWTIPPARTTARATRTERANAMLPITEGRVTCFVIMIRHAPLTVFATRAAPAAAM